MWRPMNKLSICTKKLVPLVYDYVSTAVAVATMAANRYVPRGRNELHTIFERHFDELCEHYEEKCAATYGRYRLERIQQLGDRFTACGDYLQGAADSHTEREAFKRRRHMCNRAVVDSLYT
jgi:hypothetical protein